MTPETRISDPRTTDPGTPDPRTLAALKTLIAFDTTSRNSNLACIDWARAHMESHGATTRMDWNADRTKANMLASFDDAPGGTILSGHVDTVPTDGQAWTTDPYTLSLRHGRAYGRGACDMKGFLSVVLGHVPDYAAAGEPIHVALTYDEELGCLGIPHLIAAMDRWGKKPAACIVGEPTGMRLVDAHKGGRVYRCHVTGHAAHSSLTHTAVNAIEYSSVLIARIRDIGVRDRDHGPRAEGFDVPFNTISTNLCTGGNGPNIVPAAADFLFDYRFIPGTDPAAIIAELETLAATLTAEMRTIDPAAGIAFALVNEIPALAPNASASHDGAAIHARAHALLPPAPTLKVAYGTEAGFFQRAGIPSIVCGPGSIEQAHKADEYVSLDQLAACDRFIEGVLAWP